MEGAEFKSHLLNSLCSCKYRFPPSCTLYVVSLHCMCGCRWASSSVLHVANMCRDIPMSQDELQFLIEKILRCVIEHHEVKSPHF